MKQINASEFKARCLAILDDVERSGEPVTILKRGRPVAQLLPAPPVSRPQDALRGTVTFHGDVIEPVLPAEAWEMDAGNL